MTFVLRFIKHLSILLFISIPLQLIGAVVLLLWLPIGRYRVVHYNASVKLPRALRWFDNADLYVGRNTETYLGVAAGGFWGQYNWLAFRNPTNYFGYKVLGFTVKNPPTFWTTYTTSGRPEVGDNTGSIAGYRHTEMTIDGILRYEYYLVYQYKHNPNKCFRFRLGYKLGDKPLLEGQSIQQVFVISPYHSYLGE